VCGGGTVKTVPFQSEGILVCGVGRAAPYGAARIGAFPGPKSGTWATRLLGVGGIKAPTSMREDGFVGEDAVEGGAADAELAGGAELVAAVEVEDVLDVMLDDGVEIESVRGRGRLERRRGFRAGGQGEIVRADGSVAGFEQGGFKDGGKLAHVSGPVVLQEAGQRAGAHEDRALLIARADAVEQGLGQRGDVFAAQAQRRNGEADGGEAEGEIGQQEALRGHLAQ